MPLFGFLARMFLLRRLFGGGHRRGRHPARRRSSGFGMFGPVPTYSRRTRGGAQVSVGGCCLPIPLALSLLLGLGGRRAVRRRR